MTPLRKRFALVNHLVGHIAHIDSVNGGESERYRVARWICFHLSFRKYCLPKSRLSSSTDPDLLRTCARSISLPKSHYFDDRAGKLSISLSCR